MPPAPRGRPAARRAPAGPSPWLLFGAPLGITLGAVCIAAAHAALGSPLGTAFGEKLWRIVESLTTMVVVYGPFAGAVQRANALGSGQSSEQPARHLGEPRPPTLPPSAGTPRGGRDDEHDDADPGRSRSGRRRAP